MIEIPLIYGRNRQGEEWLEYVCSDKVDALDMLEFLKAREIIIPETDGAIWKELGLGQLERERIRDIIAEFKKQYDEDLPTYYIKYDYLADDSPSGINREKLVVEVVNVSGKNGSGNYIHTLKILEADGNSGEHFEKVLKISLPKIAAIGTVDRISLSDFIIVSRPSGFTYAGDKGLNNLKKQENWLFIRRPEETEYFKNL